ncbi:discoidin domain-containing protein [Polyangium jinanense]|uniref:Discoidin domain-containing protein n=1 Tax=Polyangium jinanense TaxID=2829994 RepID=A0A9X4B0U8_9BACT|nr:discoidin domain-containing protein [Polyangium jinanense]MDC3962796.1 discoidin domain-containing protein [Polyangium jinanense]MDC3989527.1 discoidin domain-containing protein [Polyangium jinanense]
MLFVPILILAACTSESRQFDEPDGGSGSTGGGGQGGDGGGGDGGGGAGMCNGELLRISNVIASSPVLGSCCDTAFAALSDGSGLTSLDPMGLHDCEEATMWASQPQVHTGTLNFDLGKVYEIHQVVVWNSAQLNGQRGVRHLTMTVSEDESTFVPLNGSPTMLGIRAVCPSGSAIFDVDPPQKGRAIQFNIEDGHSVGAVTNVGLGEVWFFGKSCP